MTQMSHQTGDAPRRSLPAALIYTRQLLLTEKSSVSAAPATSRQFLDDLMKRATEMTAILMEIRGYRRGGQAK